MIMDVLDPQSVIRLPASELRMSTVEFRDLDWLDRGAVAILVVITAIQGYGAIELGWSLLLILGISVAFMVLMMFVFTVTVTAQQSQRTRRPWIGRRRSGNIPLTLVVILWFAPMLVFLTAVWSGSIAFILVWGVVFTGALARMMVSRRRKEIREADTL